MNRSTPLLSPSFCPQLFRTYLTRGWPEAVCLRCFSHSKQSYYLIDGHATDFDISGLCHRHGSALTIETLEYKMAAFCERHVGDLQELWTTQPLRYFLTTMPPGPASGVYYIRNISTKYYLAGTGETGDIIPVSQTDPAIFIVSETSGMYTITLQSGSGLSVGLAPPCVMGESLKWQRSQYQWNITPESPGVWNIRVPEDSLYWYDTLPSPANVVVEGSSTADQNNWEFIAA